MLLSHHRLRLQSFEAEAESKILILASRPLWPRVLNITAIVTRQCRYLLTYIVGAVDVLMSCFN